MNFRISKLFLSGKDEFMKKRNIYILVAIAVTSFGKALYAGEAGSTLVPIKNWSGLYMGINGGYTFPASQSATTTPYLISNAGSSAAISSASASMSGAMNSFSIANNGFVGGGQLGYRYNFLQNLVTGLEADIQGNWGAHQSKPYTSNVPLQYYPYISVISNVTVNKRIAYFGTFRAQLGYLLKQNLLASASTGLAYGSTRSNTTIYQSFGGPDPHTGGGDNWSTTGDYSKTRVGWAAGMNLEWMFRSNWSARVEYLYYELGSVIYQNGILMNNYTAQGALPGQPIFTNGVSTKIHFNDQIVRIALNHYF
jgi:outer membrane immunogenic protein